MLFIRKLLWDSWNTRHISKHAIAPEEVEEVAHQGPIVQRGRLKNRLVLLGMTDNNRLLNVVLESRGKDIYYVVTAYEASVADQALYQRLQGGEKK